MTDAELDAIEPRANAATKPNAPSIAAFGSVISNALRGPHE